MSYYRYSNSSYYRPSFFGGFSFFPPVIKGLMIANVGVFLLVNFFSLFQIHGFPLEYYLNYIFALYPLGYGFQPWQLVTYMFTHFGFWHLAMNMFALWMFGMELENVWGSKRFFIYYILCGLGAALCHLLINPLFGGAPVPTVGASGSVYGVLLAFGLLFPDRPIFIYFLLPIRARWFVLLYIGFEVFSGVTGTQDGVAHFAHLGGAAVGYLLITLERNGFSFTKLFSGKPQRAYSPPEYAGRIYSNSAREEVSDATYHDIQNNEEQASQQRVDEILDKINLSGYQSLTDEEKRTLFEASKRLN